MSAPDAWAQQMLAIDAARLQLAVGERGWRVDPDPGLGPAGSVFLLTRGDDGVIVTVSHDRTALVVSSAPQELIGDPMVVERDRLNAITDEWLRRVTEYVDAVAAACHYYGPTTYAPFTPRGVERNFGIGR